MWIFLVGNSSGLGGGAGGSGSAPAPQMAGTVEGSAEDNVNCRADPGSGGTRGGTGRCFATVAQCGRRERAGQLAPKKLAKSFLLREGTLSRS